MRPIQVADSRVPVHCTDRCTRLRLVRTGKLRDDAVAVLQELLLGFDVLTMFLADALAARRSRLRLRRQRLRHLLCRNYG